MIDFLTNALSVYHASDYIIKSLMRPVDLLSLRQMKRGSSNRDTDTMCVRLVQQLLLSEPEVLQLLWACRINRISSG